MAIVEIAFMRGSGPSGDLDTANPDSVTMITSSASNQVSSNAAAASGGIAAVTASSDNDVYASIGLAPNASTDPDRRLVPAGQTRAFTGVASGHKVAIIDK